MSEFIGGSRKLIGQILIEMGCLTEEQLNWGLAKQKETEELIGQILLKAGYISEDDLAMALARRFDIPFVDLDDVITSQEAMEAVPQDFLDRYFCYPLTLENKVLTIAVADPTQYELKDRLSTLSDLDVQYVVVSPAKLRKKINKAMGRREDEDAPSGGEDKKDEDSVDDAIKDIDLEFSSEDSQQEEDTNIDLLKQQAENEKIIVLVNKIILSAIQSRASDVHIESRDDCMAVRFRVDGVLGEVMRLNKKLATPAVSRIKVMANLNIAESHFPQDGNFSIRLKDRIYDCRISIVPTVEGECAMIRILSKEALAFDLASLGMEPEDLEKFHKGMRAPYGICLVAGPSGCGKTTTLYASMAELNKPDTKIITCEEPVEYHVDGMSQIEVRISKERPEKSLTFASALRAILRHDPDIILIGEIRDFETADIAIKSALTGHLVFGTLHANTAPDTISRILDLGIDRFLMAAALVTVSSQRLIRKICPKCKEEYTPTKQELEEADLTPQAVADFKFYRGRGCDYCMGRGYYGRTAVYEVMEVDEEIEIMIAKAVSIYELKKRALEKGMSTIRSSALKKVKNGISTLEELIRISAA